MSFSDFTLSEIGRRILSMELHARQRMAEWLDLVAEFDARDGAHREGHRSTADWLAFRCGIDGRTARDHVRVAKRLRDMPKVAAAFGEGRLSYSQVRALSRADEGEDEGELLQVALMCTANELERHVRQLRSAVSADLDVANQGRAKRYLRHAWNEDGSLTFFGRVAADDGAALVEAVEAKAAHIYGENGDPCCTDYPRPPIGARRADALVDLMTGGGYQTTIVLHADADALACAAAGDEPRAGEVLYLRDGPAIPSAVARRLACDARVSLTEFDLGRSTPTVSAALKRALRARDGNRCTWPGCDVTHGLEAHHIDPWEHGGPTDLINLTNLCRYHHHNVHDHGWTIRRNHDGTLLIKDPRGRELPTRPPPLHLAVAA